MLFNEFRQRPLQNICDNLYKILDKLTVNLNANLVAWTKVFLNLCFFFEIDKDAVVRVVRDFAKCQRFLTDRQKATFHR